jgi:hypothetical protein
MSKTDNAFVLIHFGSNPKYFELELYFCIMLQKYTSNNIIYMYSEIDTPASFVSEITPYVYKTVGFNDDKITSNVDFESKYTTFNTLRTCDFIFAYTLTEYRKICIIESDLVLMGNIDSIFTLNTPSILCYRCSEPKLNQSLNYTSDKSEVLRSCDASGLNGGVMLISPSEELFQEYISAIPIIAKQGCKYPNEALFEYVNNSFNNLPVKYNLSHYHTLRLNKYGMRPEDVLVYHFNETEFKHLDVIKDGWLKQNIHKPDVMNKYRVKKLPIEHFEKTIYNPYKERVNIILENINNPRPEPIIKNIKPSKSEWIEGFSKTHQRPYWSNTTTGKSVWEKPKEMLGGKKLRRKKSKRVRKTRKSRKIKTRRIRK